MVVSDSQAGLNALMRMRCGRRDELLWKIVGVGRELSESGRSLVFVWVPGHCGLIGNEWADDAARR